MNIDPKTMAASTTDIVAHGNGEVYVQKNFTKFKHQVDGIEVFGGEAFVVRTPEGRVTKVYAQWYNNASSEAQQESARATHNDSLEAANVFASTLSPEQAPQFAYVWITGRRGIKLGVSVTFSILNGYGDPLTRVEHVWLDGQQLGGDDDDLTEDNQRPGDRPGEEDL